jgi:hypothetical protein
MKFLGNYNVVALFNWDDEPAQLSFTAGELGIDPDPNMCCMSSGRRKAQGS